MTLNCWLLFFYRFKLLYSHLFLFDKDVTKLNFNHFFKTKNFSCTLFICLFNCSLMYSQDESVRALIDKFMFNPVY